jgi:hypothetical protein
MPATILYVNESFSLILREKKRFGVFENRVHEENIWILRGRK